MKTRNLSGVALDWAVEKCEEFHHWSPVVHKQCVKDVQGAYHPSTNWSQGGPIVEREGIYLRAVRYGGHPMNGQWLAQESDSNTGTMVQWVKREDWRRHYYAGPTLLIAAMRCYVASKLGDEIDIPEELK